jgi:hypothetical protein
MPVKLTDSQGCGQLERPDPKFAPPGRDLPQRTGQGRVMTETIPIKKQTGLPLPDVCIHTTKWETIHHGQIEQRANIPDEHGRLP